MICVIKNVTVDNSGGRLSIRENNHLYCVVLSNASTDYNDLMYVTSDYKQALKVFDQIYYANQALN